MKPRRCAVHTLRAAAAENLARASEPVPRPPFPASSEPRRLLFPRRARPSTLVSAAVSPPRRRPTLHPISHPQARCSSCPHSPPAAPTRWRSACAEAASTRAPQTSPVGFDRWNASPAPARLSELLPPCRPPRPATQGRKGCAPLLYDHPAALSTAGPGAPPPPPATGARLGPGGPRAPAQGKGRGTAALRSGGRASVIARPSQAQQATHVLAPASVQPVRSVPGTLPARRHLERPQRGYHKLP